MDNRLLEQFWNAKSTDPSSIDLTGIVSRVHTGVKPPAKAAPVRKTVAPRQQPGEDFVEALAHGLYVLECWQGADEWLTNAQIAERSGLTKATASRLCSVLVDLGYLAREGRRGRLRLTVQTLDLGFGSAFSVVPAAAAQPALAELAEQLDVYAALSIRRSDRVQILENVASPFHPDAVVMDVGGLLPICRSASGLAAMSALPDGEASSLIRSLSCRYGERWTPLAHQLSRTKQEYSIKGYCTSVAMLSRDVGAVAVPIIPSGSSDIFILACGMSARDFYTERVDHHIAPLMLKAAEKLSSALSN